MMKIARLAVAMVVAALLILPLSGEEDKILQDAWDHLPKAERQFQLGLAAFEAGRTAASAAAFEKCLQEMPRHAFAHYYLANIFYIGKDLERSLRHMERALADFDFMQALHDYALKQKDRSFDSYMQMLAKEYDDTSSCRARRELESAYGELDDAKSKLELQALEQRATRSRQKAHYLYFLGNIFFQLRRFSDAAEEYRMAIALNPLHADACNNLAAIHYMSGDHQGAAALLEQAEQRGLEDSLNLMLKFLVAEALGRPTEGILREDISPGEGGDLGVVRFALAFQGPDALRPPLYENCYIAYSRATRQAVLIDAGVADPRIEEFVRAEGLEIKAVLATHGHEDHTAAAGHFAGLFRAPVLVHAKSAQGLAKAPDGYLEDGQILRYDGLTLKVLSIPGHTPGSVVFLAGDILFSGDTLFRNGIGRTEEASPAKAARIQQAMIRSIRDRLLVLSGATRVCPGHGKITTIGEEAAGNPFLKK